MKVLQFAVEQESGAKKTVQMYWDCRFVKVKVMKSLKYKYLYLILLRNVYMPFPVGNESLLGNAFVLQYC